MKYKSLIACMGLVVSAASWSDNSHIDDRLVTDSIEKASMGFSDNDIVYVRENYALKSDESKADEFMRGVASTVYAGYLGVEAQGRTGDFTYSTVYGRGDIYRTGTEVFADTLLELPDGAGFDFIRAWGHDSNATESLKIFVFQSCLPGFSAGTPVTTNLGDFETGGAATPGDWTNFVSLSAVTVDNLNCTYFVRTRFGATDNSIRLYKVRAQLTVTP